MERYRTNVDKEGYFIEYYYMNKWHPDAERYETWEELTSQFEYEVIRAMVDESQGPWSGDELILMIKAKLHEIEEYLLGGGETESYVSVY